MKLSKNQMFIAKLLLKNKIHADLEVHLEEPYGEQRERPVICKEEYDKYLSSKFKKDENYFEIEEILTFFSESSIITHVDYVDSFNLTQEGKQIIEENKSAKNNKVWNIVAHIVTTIIAIVATVAAFVK